MRRGLVAEGQVKLLAVIEVLPGDADGELVVEDAVEEGDAGAGEEEEIFAPAPGGGAVAAIVGEGQAGEDGAAGEDAGEEAGVSVE